MQCPRIVIYGIPGALEIPVRDAGFLNAPGQNGRVYSIPAERCRPSPSLLEQLSRFNLIACLREHFDHCIRNVGNDVFRPFRLDNSQYFLGAVKLVDLRVCAHHLGGEDRRSLVGLPRGLDATESFLRLSQCTQMRRIPQCRQRSELRMGRQRSLEKCSLLIEFKLGLWRTVIFHRLKHFRQTGEPSLRQPQILQEFSDAAIAGRHRPNSCTGNQVSGFDSLNRPGITDNLDAVRIEIDFGGLRLVYVVAPVINCVDKDFAQRRQRITDPAAVLAPMPLFLQVECRKIFKSMNGNS